MSKSSIVGQFYKSGAVKMLKEAEELSVPIESCIFRPVKESCKCQLSSSTFEENGAIIMHTVEA